MSGDTMSAAWILLMTFWLALSLVVLAALLFGGRPERQGALVLASGSIATVLVTTPQLSRFQSVETGIVLVDLAILAALLWLALTSTRFWPLWVTAFHAVALLTHLADYLFSQPMAAAYALLQGFFVYPMMIALALGIWGHRRAVG